MLVIRLLCLNVLILTSFRSFIIRKRRLQGVFGEKLEVWWKSVRLLLGCIRASIFLIAAPEVRGEIASDLRCLFSFDTRTSGTWAKIAKIECIRDGKHPQVF